ncbi:hypothetical protein OG921_26175 [Aldersonia sp. NBC_00410]|nr:hypothetical protein [Aldersonia sp. NBC_00410]MCX5046666.1 hypothetical protein [Aldersonia sp. NBC_00410]
MDSKSKLGSADVAALRAAVKAMKKQGAAKRIGATGPGFSVPAYYVR